MEPGRPAPPAPRPLGPAARAEAGPGLSAGRDPGPEGRPQLAGRDARPESDRAPTPGSGAPCLLPGPDLNLDPGSDPGADLDPKLDPGPHLDLDPNLDPGPDLDLGPDLDPNLDPAPGPHLDLDLNLDPGPDLDLDLNLDPGPDLDLDPNLYACPDQDLNLDPGPDQDLNLDPSPDPGPHLDPHRDLDPDLDLDPRRDLDPEPDPDSQLPELDPLFCWTQEPEDYGPPSCPGSPAPHVQNCNHGHHRRGDAGLFPSFPSPSEGDPALEGPGDPDGCLDLSQTRPLLSEPEGCTEEGPRLRAVFEALDGDGDGFVRIEDFVQFAMVYGAEQVKDLTKHLDPSGLGVVSFEDFYRGVTAIRSGDSDGQLCVAPAQDEAPPACSDEFDDFVTFEANEVTDSAYMGSESTYSECETFTDEDTSTLVHPELQPEGDTDSAGGSAVPSECLDAMEEPGHGALLLLPGRSHPHSQSVVTVMGGEEHFEDYGEGSEAELSPETLCNGEHGCREPTFLSPCADPLAAKLRSILTDEAFEFYCSQCHKQINRLEDLSARLNDLEKNSPAKRLSSKKVARHLHQSGALTMEALQDPPPDPMEGVEEDIADKVVFLEKRVLELEKDTVANGEQHSRLRQENLQLVHRANALEEQLKEQELRACEMVLEETRKQKELLCKMEREKSIEVENLQARLQQLDEENSELRSCTPCLKANIERLEEEKQKLLDEIEELSLRLSDEQENRRKLGDRLSHERHQFQRDKEATQELIEDLRKQLEHLQLFKLEAEQRRGRSSSAGLQEYHSRTRESELEQEVRRLKQDNRNLKEQNDELNGQIINLSIQGAKNLFSTSFSESLAAEISSVSRDELMEAIQKQEEINFRLQDYIDRIIVAIMETNPSILEVK
ncbi:rab11 family-interacting protein 3 isoform X1 [Equus asinus]